MSKSLKIAIAVFFIVFSKVIVDIQIFSEFLSTQMQSIDIFRLIELTAFVGIVLIYVFNKIQQRYEFVWSVLFVASLIAAVPALMLILNGDVLIKFVFYAAPAYVLIVTLLLYLLFKGLSIRIAGNDFNELEQTIALSKNAAILTGGLIFWLDSFIQNPLFIQNTFHMCFVCVGVGVLGFMYLSFSERGGRDTIGNSQAISVDNSFFKLLATPYFMLLLLFGIALSFTMTLCFGFYIDIMHAAYDSSKSILRILQSYAIAIGIFGIAFELLFRKKLAVSSSVRSLLKMLPIALLAFSAFFIFRYFGISIDTESELQFFVFFIFQFMMIFAHFIFENVSIPSSFSFFLPISINTRFDFYIKSFIYGLLFGMPLACELIIFLSVNNSNTYLLYMPFFIFFAAAVLFVFTNWSVYLKYKKELQNFLNNRNYKPEIHQALNGEQFAADNLGGTQFIRYINLISLSNPVLSRSIILRHINSENNFIQRVCLIKVNENLLLESYDTLLAIKNSKYYASSPNKDKISAIIDRFEEIKQRMDQERYQEQLSISKKEDERVFGAKLAVFAPLHEKENLLLRLLKDASLPVVKYALISAQESNFLNLIKIMTVKFDEPVLSNAAYSSLLSFNENSLAEIEKVFNQTGQSDKVQLRIIQLYGAVANSEATEYLLSKINHTNQNIVSSVFRALSKCNINLNEEKTVHLKHELEELCGIMVWNLEFKLAFQYYGCSDQLSEAIKNEIFTNYNNLFNLLSLLYDTDSILLLRNNLFSSNHEEVSFALELAAIVITEDLKPLVLPLLQPQSDADIIHALRALIPVEQLSKRDMLYSIIQRDYKWINQWTKACALSELSVDLHNDDITLLLANMINPDPMLAELSALSVFKFDKEIYFNNKEIFGEKYTALFDQSVLNRIEELASNSMNYPIVKFDIINYLKQVPEFSAVQGEVLKELTNFILPIHLQNNEQVELITNLDISNYYYIVYSGRVALFINGVRVKTYANNSVISSIDLTIDYDAEILLKTDAESVLYKISPNDFSELLTQYDSIYESVIRNTDNKKLVEFEKMVRKRPVTTQHITEFVVGNKIDAYLTV